MFKKYLRRLCQLIFIFIFFYLLIRNEYLIKNVIPVNLFFRLDALLAIFTTISTCHFTYYFFPSLVLLFLLILFGNFFCWWICPFGGLIDILNMVFLRKKWKFLRKRPIFLKKLNIFLFILIIFTAILVNFVKIPNFFCFFDPFVIITRAFVFKNWYLFVFLFILLLSILWNRLWCLNICPLGFLYSLIGVKLRNFLIKKRRRKIEKERVS